MCIHFQSFMKHQYNTHIVTWEPEGRYCCTKSMAITPFWLSTDDMCISGKGHIFNVSRIKSGIPSHLFLVFLSHPPHYFSSTLELRASCHPLLSDLGAIPTARCCLCCHVLSPHFSVEVGRTFPANDCKYKIPGSKRGSESKCWTSHCWENRVSLMQTQGMDKSASR